MLICLSKIILSAVLHEFDWLISANDERINLVFDASY